LFVVATVAPLPHTAGRPFFTLLSYIPDLRKQAIAPTWSLLLKLYCLLMSILQKHKMALYCEKFFSIVNHCWQADFHPAFGLLSNNPDLRKQAIAPTWSLLFEALLCLTFNFTKT
jgi:hypothetical protein